MTGNLTLGEFPPVSNEQWDEAVRRDLKGAVPKARIYYRAEDLRGLDYPDSAPGEFPYTRGTRGDNAWRIRTVVHDVAAARAALEAGADEICFVVGEQNIDEVLEALPHCCRSLRSRPARGRSVGGAGPQAHLQRRLGRL